MSALSASTCDKVICDVARLVIVAESIFALVPVIAFAVNTEFARLVIVAESINAESVLIKSVESCLISPESAEKPFATARLVSVPTAVMLGWFAVKTVPVKFPVTLPSTVSHSRVPLLYDASASLIAPLGFESYSSISFHLLSETS